MPIGTDGKQTTRGVKVNLKKFGVTATKVKAGSPMVVNLGDLAVATAKKKGKGKRKGNL